MKQRLGIARALLPTPGVVFLDEPTAGLDPIAAASLREELRTLARSDGVTVFLTTHNLSEAEKLCDVVAVIRTGWPKATSPTCATASPFTWPTTPPSTSTMMVPSEIMSRIRSATRPDR